MTHLFIKKNHDYGILTHHKCRNFSAQEANKEEILGGQEALTAPLQTFYPPSPREELVGTADFLQKHQMDLPQSDIMYTTIVNPIFFMHKTEVR